LREIFTSSRNRVDDHRNMADGGEGVEAKSAGASIGATVLLTKKLLLWAYAVFVMANKHQKAALNIAPERWEKN
jgi:predicted protein tyrosine phosphatase